MEFNLEKADSQEFARYWAIYRNINEDFSQSYAEQIQDVDGVPYCYWIQHDTQRVGGVIMVGNNIGDFFLIPPFTDAYAVLKAILPAENRLVAQGIIVTYVPTFEMLGFEVKEHRRWMIRPTQAYEVEFAYQRVSPEDTQISEIASLMLMTFQGGVGEYGQRDIEAHRHSIENYFENIKPGNLYHQASSVLFDNDTMIAACLIQPYKSQVTIRFVITHPDYRNQGLARQLMEHSINTIQSEHDYITLAVTIGNPAQRLYYNMGFLPGDATYTLVRGS